MFDYKQILFDKSVYGIHLLPARSPFASYRREEELLAGKTEESNLSGIWKGRFFEDYPEDISDLLKEDYDFTSERDVEVPLSIELQGITKPQYVNTEYPFDGTNRSENGNLLTVKNPCILYFRDVIVEEKGDDVFHLDVKGFESGLFVYVNGEEVGYSENLYLDSEFDVTPFLKEGRNRIALLCFRYSSSSWLLDQDFFRFTGLFRDVTLFRLPKQHLNDIRIQSEVDLEKRTAEVAVSLTGPLEGVTKILSLQNQDGEEIDRIVFEGMDCHFSMNDIALWSAETPNLYRLVLTMAKEGKVLEIIKEHFGLKKVEIRDGILLMNGKRMVVNGINRHEWNPERGRNITLEDLAFDGEFLKENNVNAIRTSHYPNRNEFYDMADEKGFYVMDEACLESHGTILSYRGWVEDDTPLPASRMEWEHICIEKVKRMYLRDKNHPSIFMYSLGNEAGRGEVFRKMKAALRQLDPTLLVHYEGYNLREEWSDLSDVTSTMYAKPKDIPVILEQFPNKPYLQCEYAHAMGNSLGNLKEYHELVRTYPNYQGGFIWDYIDQGLYTDGQKKTDALHFGGDYLDKPNDHDFCCNGVIFADRKNAQKSSKALAMKHHYQPFYISRSDNGILLENELLFVIGTYHIVISVSSSVGKKILAEKDIAILPGEKKEIPLSVSPSETGFLIVEVFLTETMLGRKNDDLISYQDFPLKPEEARESGKTYPITVTKGNFNIGVTCGKLSLLFSLTNLSFALSGLISVKVDGEEYLALTAVPTIFRATTNNDQTDDFLTRSRLALSYSRFMKVDVSQIRWEQEEDSFSISYHYLMDEKEKKGMTVTYRVNTHAELLIEVEYEPVFGLDTLGEIALSLPMAKSVNSLRYFGRKTESYPDRKEGNPIGWYSMTCEEGYTDYIYPQENGNHEDTSVLILSCERTKLKFISLDKNFSFRYQEYDPIAIDAAKHREELVKSNRNYLEIIGFMRGVGGDDSWGAPVHPQYEIDGKVGHCFRFLMKTEERED